MKRRDFLKVLGGITATPLMGGLSELAYGAGPFTDYRALVCIFSCSAATMRTTC